MHLLVPGEKRVGFDPTFETTFNDQHDKEQSYIRGRLSEKGMTEALDDITRARNGV